MDIQEFFQLCEGQWVSQRTEHHILQEKTDVARADLWMECLSAESSPVIEACKQSNLPADQAICGLEVTWKATLSNGRTQIGTTLLVPVLDPQAPHQGRLISQSQQGAVRLGTFTLGQDEVMTLVQTQDHGTLSERIWFASPNLRIRSSTLTHDQGTSEANFCSEIRRMGSLQPKPDAHEAQKSPLLAWQERYQQQQQLSP
ncbi:phycobiliprotein lyase [Lyngbya confervoides]|uniref:Chromophore lyase CpcS/CpeS n=1 Tax=Lyngbya confervoides BDU141951 TaxID=1574623 RepID=A0ABD4T7V3_9CYAN|nr:phycobiliprotein lyase [Lyngbya confervoides]MCM1984529.1 phycobiliprotein lyase [Lyngbya confervoides BDU141951]